MAYPTGFVNSRSRLVRSFLRIAVVGIACFHPGALTAQDTRGGLVGTAVDHDGDPVSSVRVTVVSPDMLGVRTFDTDGSGRFRFDDLPAGVYEVRLARIGFQPVTYSGARVLLGTNTPLGQLEIGSEAIELAPIRVLAEIPPIDPVSPAMSSVIEASSFNELPIARDYQSMIAVLPHANESFLGDGANIAGSTGLENAYFIDGVNVTDPYLGAGGTRLPYNFIQSIQVRTGGYEAEFGRALGGIVNAVTHSGSNRFEGSAFVYYTGSALAGDPRVGLVDLGSERFTTFDVGLRAGGPLARDHAWFTLAYNPRVELADRVIPGHGEFEDRMVLHSFASKVNWRPSPNSDVEASFFGDPSTHHRVGPRRVASAPRGVTTADPLLNLIERGGHIGSLRLRHQVSGGFVIRSHLSHSDTRTVVRPDTADGIQIPKFIDQATSVWSGGPGFLEDVRSGRTTAALSATIFLGSHTFKAGGEYQAARTDFRRWVETIVMLNSTLFQRDTEGTGSPGNPHPHWNRTAAFFVQDAWQVSDRFVVNAGLRWSRQRLSGPSASQTFPNEWQPRAGVVYQLGEAGTQRLFGSAGRFYQQIPVRYSAVNLAPYAFGLEFFSSDPRLPGALPDSGGIFNDPGTYPDVSGARSDHFDEFTLGYERLLPGLGVLRVRGIHRILREAFGIGFEFSGLDLLLFMGNYGEGDLSFLPRASRRYTGLEATIVLAGGRPLQGQLSYVLSRTQGNYSGLFGADHGEALPNGDWAFQFAESGPNSAGLLPGDRTHVAKLVASYRLGSALTIGTFTTVQSGSPLSRLGAGEIYADVPVFLVTRGSAGRSPVLWDVNFRFAYELPFAGNATGRILLDVLHVGSPRRAAWLDQFQFLGRDINTGAQSIPNPNFLQPNTYQPPMAARLGLEVGF